MILEKVDVIAEKLQLPEKEKIRLNEKTGNGPKKRGSDAVNNTDLNVKKWLKSNRQKKVKTTVNKTILDPNQTETSQIESPNDTPGTREDKRSRLKNLGLDELSD